MQLIYGPPAWIEIVLTVDADAAERQSITLEKQEVDYFIYNRTHIANTAPAS